MRNAFRRITTIIAMVFIAGISFTVHAAAMPMNHEMGGMKHTAVTSNCVTLCTTSVYNDDLQKTALPEAEEDEPNYLPPHYSTSKSVYRYSVAGIKEYARGVRPPFKIPIHLRNSVIRV